MDLNIDCIIGIDAGASGGITVWKPNAHIECIKMPKELMDLKELFAKLKSECKTPIVFLEKVQLRNDDLGNTGKAFRIQEMLNNYQRLKDILEFSDMPFVLVHPMSWQSYLKLRRKKEEKKDRKNRYKHFAQECFPEVRATLWNCDASILVVFGKKKMIHEPEWILSNLPERYREMYIEVY